MSSRLVIGGAVTHHDQVAGLDLQAVGLGVCRRVCHFDVLGVCSELHRKQPRMKPEIHSAGRGMSPTTLLSTRSE